MSDLVSRKALEKAIRAYADEVGYNRGEHEPANGILKSLSIVDSQPTAYDADKVVEQLEGLKSNLGFGGTIQTLHSDGNICKAIEIVKGGGMDE